MNADSLPNDEPRQPGYPLQEQANPSNSTTGYRAPSSWIGRTGPNEVVEDLVQIHADAVYVPVP